MDQAEKLSFEHGAMKELRQRHGKIKGENVANAMLRGGAV
jgi:hypothetical protein